MMMGLAVLNNDGLSAILFYAVVYMIMNVGAFLVVGMIANVTGDEDIENYRGLAWRGAIVPAVCLAIFLFSLTGLPPFAGFIGKFFLFSAVIKQGGAFAVLAIVAALNSVVSLYYYAKIVKNMFLDSPNPEDKTVSVAVNDFTLLFPLTASTLVLGRDTSCLNINQRCTLFLLSARTMAIAEGNTNLPSRRRIYGNNLAT